MSVISGKALRDDMAGRVCRKILQKFCRDNDLPSEMAELVVGELTQNAFRYGEGRYIDFTFETRGPSLSIRVAYESKPFEVNAVMPVGDCEGLRGIPIIQTLCPGCIWEFERGVVEFYGEVG